MKTNYIFAYFLFDYNGIDIYCTTEKISAYIVSRRR